MKVFIFILFVIVLFVWYMLNTAALLWGTSLAAKKRSVFLMAEVAQIPNILGLLAFVWILSGYFDIRVAGWLFLVTQVSVLLPGLLWAFHGSPKGPLVSQVFWEGSQLGKRHPVYNLATKLFSVFFMFGFPIAAGIAYFKHPNGSPELIQSVVRTTIVWLLAYGTLFSFAHAIMMLSSENLHEDARARTLITQLGNFIWLALIISLVFWAYGISDRALYTIDVGILHVTISPAIIATLILVYGLVYILPYYLGTKRAVVWQQQLKDRELRRLESISGVLGFPRKKEDYIAKLQTIGEAIEQDRAQLAEERPGLMAARKALLQYEQGSGWLMELFAKMSTEGAKTDPGIAYLNSLGGYEQEIAGIVAELAEGGDSNAEMSQKIQEYAKAYAERGKKISEPVEEMPRTSKLVGVMVTIVVFFVSPLVTGISGQARSILYEALHLLPIDLP